MGAKMARVLLVDDEPALLFTLSQLLKSRGMEPVLARSAQGSERIAVRAMKSGAYEYVTKPFDIDEMSLVLDRALEARSLRVQNRRLTAEKALGRAIVGDSPPMRRLLE